MIKLIELFAGIGAQTQALKNIGVEHEVVAISEIDKYAIQTYECLHGPVNNLGDICRIDKLPYADILTYSFPCQSISASGKQEGLKKGSGTRSGLLWEVERLLLNSEKPKVLLMENVKNLVSKKFISDFNEWCMFLEELGYKNYWKILNAKDYGSAQNRERVFMISIMGDCSDYNFPNVRSEHVCLNDILDSEPDSKLFFKDEIQNRYVAFPNDRLKGDDISILGTTAPNPYDDNGNIKFDKCTSAWVLDKYKLCNTLAARDYKQPKQIFDNGKIRKLSTREYSKLMGWTDEQYNKIIGVSNTQLYKQYGNSIVVNVLEDIFKCVMEVFND